MEKVPYSIQLIVTCRSYLACLFISKSYSENFAAEAVKIYYCGNRYLFSACISYIPYWW